MQGIDSHNFNKKKAPVDFEQAVEKTPEGSWGGIFVPLGKFNIHHSIDRIHS